MAGGPPDVQPTSPKGLHAGKGSASMRVRGLFGLESGLWNASRVEQTEKARVCATGRHPEGQKDWKPAGKQIHDIRVQQDMAAIPLWGCLQSLLPWQQLEYELGWPSELQCRDTETADGGGWGWMGVVYRQHT